MIMCIHVLDMHVICSIRAEKEIPSIEPQVNIYVQHNHCWFCFHDAHAGTVSLMENVKAMETLLQSSLPFLFPE